MPTARVITGDVSDVFREVRRVLRDDATPIPATVLDPFTGAGTTGLVATGLGRDFVGAELNPEYAAMARARIKAGNPLYVTVQ